MKGDSMQMNQDWRNLYFDFAKPSFIIQRDGMVEIANG
jgi:hypothetical protein